MKHGQPGTGRGAGRPRLGRDYRLAALLLGTGALLAVVAAASREPLGSSGAGSVPAHAVRAPALVLGSLALVVALVLTALLASLLVPLFADAFRRREPDDLVVLPPPLRGRSMLALGPVLVLTVAFALAVVFAVGAIQGNRVRTGATRSPALVPRPLAPASPPRRGSPSGASPTGFGLPVAAVAAGGALLGLSSLVLGSALVAHRRRERGLGPPGLRADLEAAIDESLSDLEASASPRAAVIRTYARMQGALSRQGVERLDSDAPREYLARARSALSRSDAVLTRLTELFEEARFSEHPMGEPMRIEATEALAELRAGLEA